MPRFLKLFRRLAAARSGASALEFAIVAPAFFTMVLGLAELGRMAWTQSSLQYAVERAARCASLGLPQCATTSDIQSYAAANLEATTIAANSFSVSSCANSGTEVSISVPFAFMVPALFPWQPVLASASCYPGTQSS